MDEIKFELERLTSYDDASLLDEIRRVNELVSKEISLTATEFDKHSKVSSSTIRKRFGGWQNALTQADLSYRYSGRSISEKMLKQTARYMSDKEILAELNRVAKSLGSKTLTVENFQDNSYISSSVIANRFGSWNKGLKAAGLNPTNHGRRYTEDEYFENLLAVWTHYGRQPKYAEMDVSPSLISSGAYEKKWKKWTKALHAFVQRINSDISSSSEQPRIRPIPKLDSSHKININKEVRRKIPLGLRYDVLRRGRFKCSICGNSPSNDLNCKLHIDHIFPVSKGGKTIASNLRVLCELCNLGKSDKT